MTSFPEWLNRRYPEGHEQGAVEVSLTELLSFDQTIVSNTAGWADIDDDFLPPEKVPRLMPNQLIAELIARKLRDGLLHPGDPERNIAPTPIALPFRTTGMPAEMADLINDTVKLLSEAIVHAIESEGDCEIVPRADAKSLRIAAGDKAGAPNLVPVHCRCDRDFQNPLVILTVTDPDRIVVDGRVVIANMARRSEKCPHEEIQN